MTNLSPDQFGALSRAREEDHDIVGYNDTFYHGTTPEAAEQIKAGGFSLSSQRNGRSGGAGVYLHDSPSPTRQYGPTTIEARLRDGLRIHENPYADPQTVSTAHNWAEEDGSDPAEHLPKVLNLLGYHGYRDPDDHSTVVFDPSNVEYRRHV